MSTDEPILGLDAHRHWIITVSLICASVAVALSWLIQEVAQLCVQTALVGVGGCYATLTTADTVVRVAAGVAVVAFAVVLLLDVRAGRIEFSWLDEEANGS